MLLLFIRKADIQGVYSPWYPRWEAAQDAPGCKRSTHNCALNIGGGIWRLLAVGCVLRASRHLDCVLGATLGDTCGDPIAGGT